MAPVFARLLSVACIAVTASGYSTRGAHVRLSAANETKNAWHKDMGTGLAKEHNVDTRAGQTNATASYESVMDRTDSDTRNPYDDLAEYEPTFVTKKGQSDTAKAQDDEVKKSAEGDKVREDDVEKRAREDKENVAKKTEAGGEETPVEKPKKKEDKTWVEETTGDVKDVFRSGAAAQAHAAVVSILAAVFVAAQL